LQSVRHNASNRCSEFYKYMKRRKENWEIIPATENHNGTIIKDSTEKANIFYSYYVSVYCYDRNIPEIKLANSGETFIINTEVIRKNWEKQISRLRTNSWCILKLGGVPMTPYLVRLLEISLNNAAIPSD